MALDQGVLLSMQLDVGRHLRGRFVAKLALDGAH
jgi:hypothetical protein